MEALPNNIAFLHQKEDEDRCLMADRLCLSHLGVRDKLHKTFAFLLDNEEAETSPAASRVWGEDRPQLVCSLGTKSPLVIFVNCQEQADIFAGPGRKLGY